MSANLDQSPGPNREKPRSAWRAVLLSLVTTGLGQLYNGQPVWGLVFFLAMTSITVLSYLMYWFAGMTSLLVVLSLSLLLKLAAVIHAAAAARRRKVFSLRPYNRWFVYLGVFLATSALSWGMQSSLFHFYTFTIPSGSMQPALQIGDFIMVDTTYYDGKEVSRGDVVVFRLPEDRGKIFVKRVIGLPGERVEIKARKVYINGRVMADPWAKPAGEEPPAGKALPPQGFGPVRVPAGQYFFLGDNRAASYDSRYWQGGPFVPRGDIIGKALYILWAGDWSRLGQRLGQEPRSD